MSDADQEPGTHAPSAPQAAPATAETQPRAPRTRAFALPDGWVGVLLLVLVGALFAGLLAVYWPSLTGGGNDLAQDRLEALETRIGQLAVGRNGEAAAASFGDLRRELMAAEDRLGAAEARLMALEKGAPSQSEPITREAPDVGALRAQLGAANAGMNDFGARLAKLETSSVSAPALADLTAKFTAVEAKVTALETALNAATGNANAQSTALTARVATLEANTPPDLSQRLEGFALKAATDAVEMRVAKLEESNTASALQRAGTLLALAELSRASSDPQPFALQLQTFAALAPGDPAIAALQADAAKGVPTRAQLAERFPDTAANALDIERNANAQGFLSRLWLNVKSLISVRRVGNVAGTDSGAILARAGTKLDTGDFADAVAECAQLKGAAANAMALWQKDASARLRVEQVLAQTNARIIGALAKPPAPIADDTADSHATGATGDAPKETGSKDAPGLRPSNTTTNTTTSTGAAP